MVNSATTELLGETLYTAGLISESQIQVVLSDREYNPNLRLGEILAIRGWIEQQTADFFADEWQYSIEQPEKYPLGYYLQQAGLLKEHQIDSILQEQRQIWVKFGSVAVLQGFIKQSTLNFFLKHLFPSAMSESSFVSHKNQRKIESVQPKAIVEIDDEDIPWIN